MLPDEPNFIPYPPGKPTAAVVRRIHEGTTPQTLTVSALETLGVAKGNADRVQRALRFLGLIDEEFVLTTDAVRLRRATSDEYQTILAEIIRAAYAPFFVSYEPATATDADLNNAFKPYDPAGQRPNMIGAFMALCREAGLAPEIKRRSSPGRTNGPTPKITPPGGRKHDLPPPPPPPPNVTDVLFHPAVDAFLREARKLTEGDGWTQTARDNVVKGFTTQLDLFLPVKESDPE